MQWGLGVGWQQRAERLWQHGKRECCSLLIGRTERVVARYWADTACTVASYWGTPGYSSRSEPIVPLMKS